MGDTWDWTFNQAKMLKSMKAGATRSESLQKLHAKISEGVCMAMSYNWVKRRMRGEKATATTYTNKTAFKKLAVEQASYKESGQGLGYFADRGKAEGVKMTFPAPTDKKFRNLFGGKNEGLIFCLDRLDPGLYIYNCRGNGGHAMAIDIDGKGVGTFFDPNIGQCTVAKGEDRTIGEFIGAIMVECDEYNDNWVKNSKVWWQAIRCDVTDLKKLKESGFEEEK